MHKILYFAATTLVLFACGDESTSPKSKACGMPSDCKPANGSDVEVMCPEGGEEYAPGDTVHLVWRANISDYSGWVPGVSLDGGQTWKALSIGSIEGDDAGPENQCFQFDVIVPEDGSWTANGTDLDNVMMRVKDYNSTAATMRDASESFTILAE